MVSVRAVRLNMAYNREVRLRNALSPQCYKGTLLGARRTGGHAEYFDGEQI